MDDPKKRQFVVEMVRDFKKKGVPINGIGMQGHWNLDEPKISAIEDSIKAFAGRDESACY